MSDRRYFVMSEEKSANFWARYQEAVKPGQEAMSAFIEEYSADNVWVSQGLGGESVVGLVFNNHPGDKKGLKIKRKHTSDGYVFVATPNRRYKEGKQLQKQIGLLNSKRGRAADYSNWAINELGMQSERMTDRYLSVSAAGYVKKQVVLSVPAPNFRDQEFPTIHPDLTEIKKSEFIALTEE